MLVPVALVLLAACGDEGFAPQRRIITELTVTPDAPELLVGEEVQLLARLVDQNGEVLWIASLAWSSSDTSVARVGPGGILKAVAPGSATITATWQSVKNAVVVTVHGWTKEVDGIGRAALYGVWGTSANDVFAVGLSCSDEDWTCWGSIHHYDGDAWTTMAAPMMDWEGLTAIWGSSARDVFAVGQVKSILHYDGTGWATMQSSTTEGLRAVWGSSSEDVFAVGAKSVVVHYDGQRWTPMVTPARSPLTAVWGSSGTDVFAVGFAGTILHYDGAAWTPVPGITQESLLGVWGTSSTNVFAVGVAGTLLHYDGIGWNSVPTGTTYDLAAVGGTGANDVFVVGADDYDRPSRALILHYDGTAWTVLEKVVTPGLFGVFATEEDVFAVGPGSTIVHGKR